VVVKNVFQVTAAGLGYGIPQKLLGCPFIVNEAGETERLANVYLEARFTGKWHPQGPNPVISRLAGCKRRRPSVSYVKDIAGHVDLFRRFCADPSHHDGETVDYIEATEGHLDEWAEAMDDGSFAQRGGGLEASSINIYLGSVIGFLQYLAAKKLRSTLDLSVDLVKHTVQGTGAAKISAMSGLPATLYDTDANGADVYGEPKPPWRERKEACLAATSTKSKAGRRFSPVDAVAAVDLRGR
jgi:hypothetical protein